MTRQFAIYFKHKTGCVECRKLPGKEMCEGCLAKARRYWHQHVATRHEKGLCISCQRKHKPGEQRCRVCAKENRERCLTWSRTTGKTRLAKAREAGLCGRCMKVPAGEGHYYCEGCRKTTRDLATGARQPVKKPYKYLSMVERSATP